MIRDTTKALQVAALIFNNLYAIALDFAFCFDFHSFLAVFLLFLLLFCPELPACNNLISLKLKYTFS